MAEQVKPKWKCMKGHTFAKPSYSPGWTEYIDEYMTRHHGDRHICPVCFTPEINPIGAAPSGYFKKRCVIKTENSNV